MYHRLQFRGNCVFDLQKPGMARLEQVLIEEGEIIEATVRPYVEETEEGPVEFADLALAGDGVLLGVRMDYFAFV